MSICLTKPEFIKGGVALMESEEWLKGNRNWYILIIMDSENYKTKTEIVIGSNYIEVKKADMEEFKVIKQHTKRKPYIRSAYFKKQKIFFDYFWVHMAQKPPSQRYIRLKYFKAALEVVKNSTYHPKTAQNPNKTDELLHRFGDITKEGHKFYVQIKENMRTGAKQFMSIFPAK